MKILSFILFVITSCAGMLAPLSADTAVRPALEEVHPTLHWVGCGISKKAYMVALAKAYEEQTGVKIDIQGGGATRGIRDVAAVSADIGGSCRRRIFGAKEERGVTQVPVAWDALVVIVNKDNPVQNISLDDLRKVFLGQLHNWQELGGADAPIELYARKGKISGVGRTARKLLFDNYEQEFAASKIFDSSGPLEQEVEVNPNAIAISGIRRAITFYIVRSTWCTTRTAPMPLQSRTSSVLPTPRRAGT